MSTEEAEEADTENAATENHEFDPLKTEIMRATYRALITQGYSDLTMQGIADEFAKSKSLLYYHYDGKADLLAEFLEFALHRFETEIAVEEDDPAEQLRTLVDRLVPEELEEDSYHVQIALLELRSEAPHEDLFRDQYTAVDERITAVISGILRRGVETGTFTDIDPETEAELLVSLLIGARTRRLTSYEEFDVRETRRALETYLDRLPSTEDGTTVGGAEPARDGMTVDEAGSTEDDDGPERPDH